MCRQSGEGEGSKGQPILMAKRWLCSRLRQVGSPWCGLSGAGALTGESEPQAFVNRIWIDSVISGRYPKSHMRVVGRPAHFCGIDCGLRLPCPPLPGGGLT